MNEIVKWTSLMVKISCLHVQSLSLDYGRKCVSRTWAGLTYYFLTGWHIAGWGASLIKANPIRSLSRSDTLWTFRCSLRLDGIVALRAREPTLAKASEPVSRPQSNAAARQWRNINPMETR